MYIIPGTQSHFISVVGTWFSRMRLWFGVCVLAQDSRWQPDVQIVSTDYCREWRESDDVAHSFAGDSHRGISIAAYWRKTNVDENGYSRHTPSQWPRQMSERRPFVCVSPSVPHIRSNAQSRQLSGSPVRRMNKRFVTVTSHCSVPALWPSPDAPVSRPALCDAPEAPATLRRRSRSSRHCTPSRPTRRSSAAAV